MSQAARKSTQNRPLPRMAQQLDLDGRAHDIGSQSERLRLFERARAQIAGQTFIDTDQDDSESV